MCNTVYCSSWADLFYINVNNLGYVQGNSQVMLFDFVLLWKTQRMSKLIKFCCLNFISNNRYQWIQCDFHALKNMAERAICWTMVFCRYQGTVADRCLTLPNRSQNHRKTNVAWCELYMRGTWQPLMWILLTISCSVKSLNTMYYPGSNYILHYPCKYMVYFTLRTPLHYNVFFLTFLFISAPLQTY